jgi:hypothetical protein
MSYKLTPEEKTLVESYTRQQADPSLGDVYEIEVGEDDDGQIRWRTIYERITVMPKGWKPDGPPS